MRWNEDYNIEGYLRLAAAVVERAVLDYKRALRRLYRHPKDLDAKYVKEECERFFRRDMGIYSDIDGELIIREIKERVNEEMGR